MRETKISVLGRKLKSKQVLYGYSNAEMGVKMRISERTWNRYLADPGNMKVKDLIRLESLLKTNLVNESCD